MNKEPNFKNKNDLLPAIIQNALNNDVLMLGYMNREAYNLTVETKKVTFFSRSRQKLWVKGETSSNFLNVNNIYVDCDKDTILIKAIPEGPTCHTGDYSCFGIESDKLQFLSYLQQLIEKRKKDMPENSYTTKLFTKGINKIAQKVGEEAVELIIEAKDNNRELFVNEAADLMYHLLVLLSAKNESIENIVEVLKKRHS